MEYPKIFEDEVILNDADLLHLIREKTDLEIAEYIGLWKEESEITYEEYAECINSDLTSYEEELCNHNTSASEMYRMILELMMYVNTNNRINRKRILDELKVVMRELKTNFDI